MGTSFFFVMLSSVH